MSAPPGVVWDACALINLLATDRAAEILATRGRSSYVVARVRTQEVFYLRPLPEDDPPQGLILADATELMEAGLLADIELDAAEQETFAELARELDDGEARTGAVAIHRRLWMATDDRATIRLLRALPTPVPIWTTPEWLKQWADAAGVPADVLATVLRRIQVCAHYTPRRTHPLRDWWDRHLPPA